MLTSLNCCWTSELSKMVAIVFAADLNILALSEMIRTGNPRLDVKRLKLQINDGADMSGTKSKCTTLVAQQVYRQIQLFLDVDVTLSHVYKGPAKSMPVKENGWLCLTLKEGSGGADGGWYGLLWNLQQVTHLCKILLTKFLPLTIQYLDHNSVSVAFTPPCFTLV